MIVGEVIEILSPSEKFKVRVENSPGLLQDVRQKLRDGWKDTTDKLVQVQIEFENSGIYAQISNLEDEIKSLEEQGTLSSSHKIIFKYQEIRNLEARASQYINTLREIENQRKNYEYRMAKFGREPDYYDYDIFSSTYRALNVGDKVNVIFHSYDTATAVIAPEYEADGFGSYLVGTFTQSHREWFRNTLLEPYLTRKNQKYMKARVNSFDESTNTFSITTFAVLNEYKINNFKTGTVLTKFGDEYNSVRWTYKQGAERPYFVGDDVLVKFSDNTDDVPMILGFWQAPRPAFRYTGVSSIYKQGYKIEGGMLPSDTFKTNLSTSTSFDNGQAADIYSRLVGYSSINNYDDITLMLGYCFSKDGVMGTALSSSFTFPNLINEYMPIKNGLYDFDGRLNTALGNVNDLHYTANTDLRILRKGYINNFSSPRLCNGREYTKSVRLNANTSGERIVFHPQIRFFRNYIFQVNDNYAYLRTGYAVIPDDLQTVYIDFNDGNGYRKRNWTDSDVQQLYTEICQYNQGLIDSLDIEDRDKVYLYDRENGQHFNDFKTFYDTILSRRVFFEGPKFVSFDERRVRVDELPKITGLYDATNTRSTSSEDVVGSFPNMEQERLFFSSNYSFKDYPSQDKNVVAQYAKYCNPYLHLGNQVVNGQFIPAGTLENQPYPVVIVADRSKFEIQREYQNWGYRDAYVDVYYQIHDFTYEEIEFIE